MTGVRNKKVGRHLHHQRDTGTLSFVIMEINSPVSDATGRPEFLWLGLMKPLGIENIL